ncbi:MAG: hypothetical protein M1826_003070 [Phylliscum demangeonii]|nr:MAG: hypothetical protein M1826_003070 [Phylliscum demangeonii]
MTPSQPAKEKTGFVPLPPVLIVKTPLRKAALWISAGANRRVRHTAALKAWKRRRDNAKAAKKKFTEKEPKMPAARRGLSHTSHKGVVSRRAYWNPKLRNSFGSERPQSRISGGPTRPPPSGTATLLANPDIIQMSMEPPRAQSSDDRYTFKPPMLGRRANAETEQLPLVRVKAENGGNLDYLSWEALKNVLRDELAPAHVRECDSVER